MTFKLITPRRSVQICPRNYHDTRPTGLQPDQSRVQLRPKSLSQGPISRRKASKANCVNRTYGAGDGNRTRIRNSLTYSRDCGYKWVGSKTVQNRETTTNEHR